MSHDRTLAQLGWPELLAALAERCRLPAGRRLALALPFLPDARAAAGALALVEEARRLAEAGEPLPLGGLTDLAPVLERAARGGLLEPLGLREVAALCRAAARTRAALLARSEAVPGLAALGSALAPDDRLAARIERAVEPDGAISDRASPALAAARERSRGLHRALRGRVEALLSGGELERHLRDRYFTIRNERYVLPVLAGSRAAVPGMVHGASQSGQTLFVEPEALVELGNELAIATATAAEEEARIVRELSEAVAAAAGPLGDALAALGRLDLAEGSARLAADLDAHPPLPGAERDGLELRALRHPLLVLQGKRAVASDVRLDPPARALVVSGPNGGGKTVAIGAVGLSALLLRAGLPVPAAAGSRLPFYLEVRAAIDERGDLHQDLSTFTAHLAAVREMLAGAVPGSLLLVDEIAADTDPREGAALAAAILEALVERGATVLVTTHLDELKALALGDARYANARVGFDAERLAPTYQLHLGSPGSSSAIEVAARLGLPPAVVARAREARRGQGGALGEALAALEAERARLEAERGACDRAGKAAHEAEARAAARERAARAAELSAAARLGESISGELEEARAEVAALLEALRSERTVQAAEEARARLDAWRAEVAGAARAARSREEVAGEALPAGALRPGVRVRIASLGQEGELLALEGGQALVRAGALKVRRPVADLVPLGGAAPPAALGRSRADRLAAAGEARPEPLASPERRLDVRGLRVDELRRGVERFLDRRYADGEGSCAILHGHGTGALKQALRELLGASPYVASFRAGDRHEGGDAVTVVELRR